MVDVRAGNLPTVLRNCLFSCVAPISSVSQACFGGVQSKAPVIYKGPRLPSVVVREVLRLLPPHLPRRVAHLEGCALVNICYRGLFGPHTIEEGLECGDVFFQRTAVCRRVHPKSNGVLVIAFDLADPKAGIMPNLVTASEVVTMDVRDHHQINDAGAVFVRLDILHQPIDQAVRGLAALECINQHDFPVNDQAEAVAFTDITLSGRKGYLRKISTQHFLSSKKEKQGSITPPRLF